MTIYFQRHGQYENPRNVMPFRMPDISLSSIGIGQIEDRVQEYKELDIKGVYSSPLRRCRETSEIISKGLDLECIFSSELLEVQTPLQGLTIEDYEKRMENSWIYSDSDHKEFGGETYDAVLDRLIKYIENLRETHANDSIIICSHADPMMIYIASVRGIELDLTKPLHRQIEYIQMGDNYKLDV